MIDECCKKRSCSEVLPHKESWIKKFTNSIFTKWPSRYFVLDQKILSCYSSANKLKFLGGVSFDKISIRISSIIRYKEIILTPFNNNQSVRLRFFTYEEYISWAEALSSHISASRGNRKVLTDFPLWSLSRISVAEFKLNAKTGDLILFKSKNVGTLIQRVFSMSDYDHIGIVYKYPTGELAILEATKQDGVSLCYWDDFLSYNWGEEYLKVVYRKLECLKDLQFSQVLDAFITQVLGKKFKFNTKKLISRFVQVVHPEGESYFCSELVAKAYQVLGILDNSVPASRYWPGDFSEKSDLELIDSKLYQEQIIDFNLVQSMLIC